MFDSGVGGLTVLHECLVTMPHEDFLYAGDTARFPYGGRSADELRGYAQEIGGWLVREGVKLIVIACNSATATALGDLQRTLDVPVIGVLTPEARAAVQLTRNRRVGLLATEATIASGRYRDVVHGLDAGIELVEVACPGLADAIQRGETYDETMVARVRAHCAPLRAAEVDTVILGCTHYPLIRGMLQRELGRDVALVVRGRGARRGGRRDARAQAHRARPRPPRLVPLRLHGRRRGVRERRPPLPAAADLERAHARRGRARGARLAAGSRPVPGSRSYDSSDATRRPRRGRAAPSRPASGLRRDGGRLGAVLDRPDARDLHGQRRRGHAALAARHRARLGQRRVRDAAGLDRRAEAARLLARPPRRPLDRDPAADRPLAARDRRPRGARRAHRVGRLRRPAGRRRHALRGDLRRLRRAAPRAQRPRRRGQAAPSCRSPRASPPSRAASSRARRCSTSTTRRTRPPRSTSTSS